MLESPPPRKKPMSKLERAQIKERRKIAAELKRATKPAMRYAVRGAIAVGLLAATYFAVVDGVLPIWAAVSMWCIGLLYSLLLTLSYQFGRANQAVQPGGFDGLISGMCYDAVLKDRQRKTMRRRGDAPK